MEYIKWITTSTTYTVPKAGKYKVICVGGGASGGVAVHDQEPVNTKCLQATGGTTSFGSYVSATGGQVTVPAAIGKSNSTILRCGGQNGFDGLNYGGAGAVVARADSNTTYAFAPTSLISNNSAGTGHGYGAGGGAGNNALGTAIKLAQVSSSSAYSKELYPVPGACGGIKSGIVDLDESQKVTCTIGTGGVFTSGVTTTKLNNYLLTVSGKSSFTSYTATPSSLSEYVTSGASGVIVIQYLG